MGRTSKFLFPLPGRKRTSNTNKDIVEQNTTAVDSPVLSKAQRFFGTGGDLNIDSPARSDNGSWHTHRPASSGMSIAVSESTEDDGAYASITEGWDRDSAVLPSRNLQGKASSTLLGNSPNEAMTETSSLTRALHSENSSSTLRSFYDRQKSPLSISQQTSASSARDLALRKGFPPVTTLPRSPLLQVDYPDKLGTGSNGIDEVGIDNSQVSKKKPARLDLSRLFHGSRKEHGNAVTAEKMTKDPIVSDGENGLSRKLTKAPLTSKHEAATSTRLQETRSGRHTSSIIIHSTNEDYGRASQQPSIVSPKTVPAPAPSLRPRTKQGSQSINSKPRTYSIDESYESSYSEDQFQWKEFPAMASPPWDTASAMSRSSRNTRSSRRSVLSNSDLRNNSVLSLSSDSDPDSDGRSLVTPRNTMDSVGQAMRGPSRRTESLSTKSSHRASTVVQDEQTRHTPNNKSSRSSVHSGRYLSIPLPAPPNNRLSGSWASGSASGSDNISAGHPSQQPSPPLSPTSAAPGSTSRSRRLMAVTKQEEALLEAMRQRRARMREKIIEEHETTKSPPSPRSLAPRPAPKQSLKTSTTKKNSFFKKVERGSEGSDHVHRYVNNPTDKKHSIETSESSLDMSDFLSFASDDDDESTPRSSWAAPKNKPSSELMVRPVHNGVRTPDTSRSTLRLSAVGTTGVLANQERGNRRRHKYNSIESVDSDR